MNFSREINSRSQIFSEYTYDMMGATKAALAIFNRLSYFGIAIAAYDGLYRFDHYERTYRMEYNNRQVETNYAIYDEGRFLGLQQDLTWIQSATPQKVGEPISERHIDRVQVNLSSPRF
jgi:hypothetical protein